MFFDQNAEPEDNTLYELLNVSRTATDAEIKKVRNMRF